MFVWGILCNMFLNIRIYICKSPNSSGNQGLFVGGVRNGFNARARANNFSIEEVSEVMQFLGAYGVKGFACLNVLVFDNELERVERSLRALERAGVDAVIVQDVGVMALAREVAPELPIHASTQQSISSADGAEFARERGATRVVVGRELVRLRGLLRLWLVRR